MVAYVFLPQNMWWVPLNAIVSDCEYSALVCYNQIRDDKNIFLMAAHAVVST